MGLIKILTIYMFGSWPFVTLRPDEHASRALSLTRHCLIPFFFSPLLLHLYEHVASLASAAAHTAPC